MTLMVVAFERAVLLAENDLEPEQLGVQLAMSMERIDLVSALDTSEKVSRRVIMEEHETRWLPRIHHAGESCSWGIKPYRYDLEDLRTSGMLVTDYEGEETCPTRPISGRSSGDPGPDRPATSPRT